GRQEDEAGVSVDVGDDVDEIDLFVLEELFRMVVDRRDVELARQGFGLGPGPVVEGDAPGVGQLPPRRELVSGPEPGPEDGEAQVADGRAFRSRNRSTFSRVTV